ncbi:MAG: SUMF1/EgtB/PvdO family nonheme iron enzyme [Bryobacteraceae bacterium]
MPPDLRQRFEQLLLRLPLWEREGERHALLSGILRGHQIWDDLILSGSAATAAVHLLDLAGKHGPDPFLVLLTGLRDSQAANPEICREIDSLEALLRSRRPTRPREVWNNAPYRGLNHFDRRHAPIFFGRENEVDELIHTITNTEQGRRFTVVVGASGAGKSSLVRAGVWARLAETGNWLTSAMTPLEMGDPSASLRASLVTACREHDGFEDKLNLASALEHQPLSELAERLLPPNDTRWLLILDQMEELFAPDKKEEGAKFIDRLLEATKPLATGKPSRFQVLATLRADFFHYCLEHPPLKRAVAREGGQFLLSAPGRLALERMVGGPLTDVELPVKWAIDPALPHVIAVDTERHPGGLALMAFALRELYDISASKRRLDLETYRGEAFGGLSGSIARRADATLNDLGDNSAKTLERVFARLVRVNRDDAPTRRREPISSWDNDPDARKLVDAFQKARLLVFDRGAIVEVAHEALLREWPKLAGWIDQRRDAFRLAERVRTEAHAWMNGNPSQHHRRPWAADVIEEIREKLAQSGLLSHLKEDAAVARLLTPEVDWILSELEQEFTTHIRRRDIGQRLAEIGDPRSGVGVIAGVPEILWRLIPRGEVLIRGGDRFLIEPFHMAAYPVTLGQFRVFLDAPNGYENEQWWSDLERLSPSTNWHSPLSNHPVTDVSWFDAGAFCRWLSSQFGFEVRLPDQEEWQWAAQSARRDFQYTWGRDWRERSANTRESDINRTTAVGMYPNGNSLQGVSELAGNVWEWCRNESQGAKRADPDRTPSRVSCGGSWFFDRDSARAANRDDYRPDFRSRDIGFRVVSKFPIRSTLDYLLLASGASIGLTA